MHFVMLQTQSEEQHEKNQDAGPSEGQNHNNCHPHQPLTVLVSTTKLLDGPTTHH